MTKATIAAAVTSNVMQNPGQTCGTTGVVNEVVVEAVHHAVPGQCDYGDPRVVLEPSHRPGDEDRRDRHFGSHDLAATIDDGEREVVGGDCDEHCGVEHALAVHA